MSRTLNSKSKYYPNQYSPSKQIDYEEDDYRIITKNLVYIIGLSESISYKEILQKYEYLGQYGKILKIVVNRKKAYNQNSRNGPSYSAYITYSKPFEAAIAILSLEKAFVDNHLIHASFGTTKYCSFYLKKLPCNNKDCVFLHKKANESDIIDKSELNCSKDLFMSQQIIAIKIGDIYNPKVKEKIMAMNDKGYETVFPSPNLIYKSQIVIENQRTLNQRMIIDTQVNSATREDSNCTSNLSNNENNSLNNKKNNNNKNQRGVKVIYDNKSHKKNIREILCDSSDEETKKGKDKIKKGKKKSSKIVDNKISCDSNDCKSLDKDKKSNNDFDCNMNNTDSSDNNNSGNKLMNSADSKNEMLKEEDSIKINSIIIGKKFQLNELDTTTTVTTSINSKDDKDDEILLTPKNIYDINCFFTSREKSRFDFANSNSNSSNIPEEIINIVNKGSKMLLINNYFGLNNKNTDFILNEELNDDNSQWLKIDNKNINNKIKNIIDNNKEIYNNKKKNF